MVLCRLAHWDTSSLMLLVTPVFFLLVKISAVKKAYATRTVKTHNGSEILTCGWKSMGSRPRHSNCTIVLKFSLFSTCNPANTQCTFLKTLLEVLYFRNWRDKTRGRLKKKNIQKTINGQVDNFEQKERLQKDSPISMFTLSCCCLMHWSHMCMPKRVVQQIKTCNVTWELASLLRTPSVMVLSGNYSVFCE